MASKVGQYFTWKGMISEEYLTVPGQSLFMRKSSLSK